MGIFCKGQGEWSDLPWSWCFGLAFGDWELGFQQLGRPNTKPPSPEPGVLGASTAVGSLDRFSFDQSPFGRDRFRVIFFLTHREEVPSTNSPCQCKKLVGIGVLFGCFGGKIDGPGLPGGLIIYQGHLFALKGHLCLLVLRE